MIKQKFRDIIHFKYLVNNLEKRFLGKVSQEASLPVK
jgi:hypothetical protein